jgi:ABC-type Fe3+/spermidine/putrescine transport system ATPase subunit
MSDYMIELRDVTKRYGGMVANDHLNLQVNRGELMTLLGPSGCGKTTALRTITGHNHPDEGQVYIDGVDVTDVPTYRRELGMVFQNFALFPHLTVYENVEFPLMIRDIPKSERLERVNDALRLIRMEGMEERFPKQLSGGQQQRVGLARALVYRPKLLLLDEPLSNLDAKLREEMRFEIKEVVNKLNMTAVYVTHDQGEALALSDRVAIMKGGRLQQVGTPREIFDLPRTRFVADFIGLSNFLEGQVIAREGDETRISAQGLDLLVKGKAETRVDQHVTVFIRPNSIELLDADQIGNVNCLKGVVDKMTYLGDIIDYRVLIFGEQELRVQTDGWRYFESGSNVCVHLNPERLHIIPEEEG